MATVIDSLIIKLGLDPKGFTEGQKKAVEDFKKTQNEAARVAKDMEARGKQAAQFFAQIKREALSLAVLLFGGVGLKEFISNTITANADIGRLSKTIGVSVETLSGWQGAVQRMGGSAGDASSAMQTLTSAFEQLQLNANSPLVGIFNKLKISMQDLEDPYQTLLKIADALHNMDPREAGELGRQLGFSASVTNTLMQGRAAVTKQVAELATVTLQQAEAAKVAQDRLVRLRQEYQRLGTEVLTKLLPVLEKLVGYLDKFAQWAERHPRLFQAALAGVAAAIIAINVASAATIIGLAGMATGAAGAAGAFAGLAASMAAVVSIAAIWAASFGGGFVAGRALAGEAVKRGLVKPRAGAETWNHDANPFSGENIGRLFGHRDATAGGAPAAANDQPAGGSRVTGIRDNLARDLGLTRDQAAGIVSNLLAEFGLRGINEKHPLIPGSRGGFGWAQWTGQRRKDFEAFASAHGLDVRSDDANYQFLI